VLRRSPRADDCADEHETGQGRGGKPRSGDRSGCHTGCGDAAHLCPYRPAASLT
jgi:hypothetical protein